MQGTRRRVGVGGIPLKHLILSSSLPFKLKSSLCTLTQCRPVPSLCHASTPLPPPVVQYPLFPPDLSSAICVTPNISVAPFALTVPPFPLLSSCLSIFCKLAALVRHRVSLFGKEPDKWRYAVSPSPRPFPVLFDSRSVPPPFFQRSRLCRNQRRVVVSAI